MCKFYEISHKGHTNDNNGNTLESIIEAINLKYDIIEMDIQLCKSGDIILYHDIHIDGKLIYDMTYEEIYTTNSRITTLRDVLYIINRHSRHVYLDLKGKGPIVYKLINLLDSLNINYNNIWIASFNYNHLIDLILLRKDLRTYKIGFITSNNFSFNILYEIKFNLDFIVMDWQNASKKFVEECHHYQILLFVYTCNSYNEFKLISYIINPDGIVTNLKIKY